MQDTIQKIQWYPGHMHKAAKQLKAVLPKIDVIVEVLDARIPFSSSNPMLLQLCGNKPVVKVMTKVDLADKEQTRVWKDYFIQQEKTRVVAADIRQSKQVERIPQHCLKLAPRNRHTGEIKFIVLGIPNVGKSTLINRLAGRAVAKTGDEPAVTKNQQWVELKQHMVLLDTPGLLWPNITNPNSGYRLAVTGAIRDTALSHKEVAVFALDYLSQYKQQLLQQRYGGLDYQQIAEDLLLSIGKKRGCLIKGGGVDEVRASKIILSDIRQGRLGGITWETPTMMFEELALLGE